MPPHSRPTSDSHRADVDMGGGVGELSRDLYRAMCRAIDARVSPYGLTAQNCRYLAIIRHRGGATAKELSEYLSVRSPTTVGALRLLESKRFLKRTDDPNDARKAIYVLTPRGAEIEALVFECASDVERRATKRLSAQERRLFRKFAELIHVSILEDLHETGPSKNESTNRPSRRLKRA